MWSLTCLYAAVATLPARHHQEAERDTCLFRQASGFWSPTAGSTTTCVTYSFSVSVRYNGERLICIIENLFIYILQKHNQQEWCVPGEKASPNTDEQLAQEISAKRRQGFCANNRLKAETDHQNTIIFYMGVYFN